MTKKPSSASFLWLALVLLSFLCGTVFFVLVVLPYPTLKALGDLLSKDGNLESLTSLRYTCLRPWGFFLGGLLLVCGMGALLMRKWFQALLTHLLAWLPKAARNLISGFGELGRDICSALPARGDMLALLLIVSLAAFLRLVVINRQMEYDEAYTYSEFARHSLRQVISDYHVPNNHVFHTILVHVSTRIFGGAPWAIRIPAFLAGLALIPAVYFLGRKLYSTVTGLTAASVTAIYPVLIFYSVNARGYSLICLLTLLLLLLGEYVRGRRNPAAWALMAILTALGFYTIPIMLYPFTIVIIWLLAAGFFGEISPAYGGNYRWLAYLFGFCLLAAFLTILLYTPIFAANGILTVFAGNRVVEPLPLPIFLSRLPFQMDSMLDEWQMWKMPGWILILLTTGCLLSLLFHRKMAHPGNAQGVSIQAITLLVLILVLLIQHPILLARVWLFLLILLILWGTAGLMELIRLVRPAPPWQGCLRRAAAALALLACLWGGYRFSSPYLTHPDRILHPAPGEIERVTRYFQQNLQDGDVVVVSNDEDAQYWYYFDAYQIPQEHIRGIKSRPFLRAYIVSRPSQHRTIESVITGFGPDLGFFRMETLRPVTQIYHTIIYEVLPYQDAVDSAFGINPDP